MCVLSIKVPTRKKSGYLFNDPRMLLRTHIFSLQERGTILDTISKLFLVLCRVIWVTFFFKRIDKNTHMSLFLTSTERAWVIDSVLTVTQPSSRFISSEKRPLYYIFTDFFNDVKIFKFSKLENASPKGLIRNLWSNVYNRKSIVLSFDEG